MPVTLSEQKYWSGSTPVDTDVTWRSSSGHLIDFSAGYTFELRTVGLTKTTGIIALPVGDPMANVPNLRVTWGAGEVGSLPVGVHTLQLRATRTATGESLVSHAPIHVRAQVT